MNQSNLKSTQPAVYLRLSVVVIALSLCSGARFPVNAQSAITVATPDAPKPVGAITGRVIGEGGQPVANARLFASSRRGTRRSNATAISDAEGKFTLNHLEHTAYTITAYAPTYFDAANLELDAGRSNYYRPGDTARIDLVRGGVVTGRVTNASGEPVIATRVNLVRVRDVLGRPVRELNVFSRPLERLTDDLGVYRVYGLLPGTYLVSAGGKLALSFQLASPYDNDAPTYYPSTTRDAATEVVVQAGQEVGAIDIRYRGEPGHAVGGVVVGANKPGAGEGNVSLSIIASGTTAVEGFAFFGPGGDDKFSFSGLGDGEYDLVAERYSSTGGELQAAVLHVSVRGADVTGLRILLTPLASVAGRVVIAPSAYDQLKTATNTIAATPCPSTANAPRAEEIVILALRDAREANRSTGRLEGANTAEGAPDDKGDFTISGMDAGRYRLDVQLPGDDLYLRALAFDRAANAATTATTTKPDAPNAKPKPATTAATAANDPARVGLRLGAGEQLGGLVVNVARGAASLRGRVAPANASEPPLGNLRVYLLPAEPERADDVLRFYDTDARVDGSFNFKHLAPGRYLVVARAMTSTADSAAPTTPPLAWNAPARAALRREAAAANNTLDLAPCQRATDYRLAYTPPK